MAAHRRSRRSRHTSRRPWGRDGRWSRPGQATGKVANRRRWWWQRLPTAASSLGCRRARRASCRGTALRRPRQCTLARPRSCRGTAPPPSSRRPRRTGGRREDRGPDASRSRRDSPGRRPMRERRSAAVNAQHVRRGCQTWLPVAAAARGDAPAGQRMAQEAALRPCPSRPQRRRTVCTC